MAPTAVKEPPADSTRCNMDEVHFAQLYAENMDVLVSVAVRKFKVPAVDAEGLAHDVLLSYLKRKDEIRELHKWLIGAICNASRYYWRKQGRNTESLDAELASVHPDPASINNPETILARIVAGEALAGLSPRYQQILRLRYYDGLSIREIAEHLGVTAKYAQKLVIKCLRRAEEVFNPPEGGKKK